ncbi:Ion channel [Novipirellula aureliae]|uniref:Ion channel n=1 Tax=Novipirellula aureliae TaxID=2527966 RepID=A0A5C6EBF2_9BACT|nr:potassium channel family protein [Novipirellula aureliae]TWU45805.1 Ion channel [Novipirellula aureliae]
MTSANRHDRSALGWALRLSHLDLLVTMVLLQLSQSFLSSESGIQRGLFNLLFLVVVISAIRTLSSSKIRMISALTIGGIGFLLASYADFHHSVLLIAATDSCYVVVFLLLILSLAESVFRKGPADLNRIVGAACIYFVIGLFFAFVFSLLETFQPGAFALSPFSDSVGIHQDTVSNLIYFSNVTLTSLGYGDIIPITRPARTLATLEAMVGQLYLAIVVAKLVGLHIAEQK